MVYLLSFLACIGFTFFLEAFFKPYYASLLKRRIRGLLITMSLVLITQAFFLLVTHRPMFSVVSTLIMVSVLLAVNNAKYAALREPLVFSDLFLYLQAIHYPRLYFPFLGLPALILLPIVFVSVIYFGFALEKSVFNQVFIYSLLLVFVIGLAITALLKLAAAAVISGDLETDIKRFGILSTLCIYATLASSERETLALSLLSRSRFRVSTDEEIVKKQGGTQLPDIIAVQSESFFDARKVSETIKKDVLSHYDQCLLTSFQHGALSVPAWGANTMRTEFAFLTGYTPDALGLARFYPYHQLLKMNKPQSLIAYLKQLGYYCICIHPHDAGFFLRDQFFKKLGFDEFMDEASFENPERVGPYISDAEVCQKIIRTSCQQQNDQPLFIFAITMENHGPLHLESVGESEWEQYFEKKPEAKDDDLTVYLRHLNNADAMIDGLTSFYKQSEKQVGLVFYGDHVPAISETFDHYGYADDRSNYFIWNNYLDRTNVISKTGRQFDTQDIKVEDLALTLLSSLNLSPQCHNKL